MTLWQHIKLSKLYHQSDNLSVKPGKSKNLMAVREKSCQWTLFIANFMLHQCVVDYCILYVACKRTSHCWLLWTCTDIYSILVPGGTDSNTTSVTTTHVAVPHRVGNMSMNFIVPGDWRVVTLYHVEPWNLKPQLKNSKPRGTVIWQKHELFEIQNLASNVVQIKFFIITNHFVASKK